MALKGKTLKAKFEQVLLFAGEPQVVLLSGPAGSKVVGVAIDRENMELPFFGALVTDEQFVDYIRERFDLRYLLMKPDMKRHFIFDMATLASGEVKLSRHKPTPEEHEDLFPDAGLFAREHTEPVKLPSLSGRSEETFGIDGKWDLEEFSKLYGQVTDLYAVFSSVDAFLDQQASLDKRRAIQEAFLKPFEGGGSYVSLYKSLTATQPRSVRLDVQGIQYHSPGYVKVKGQTKPLSEVRELVGHLEQNLGEIEERYKALYDLLRQHNLLRMPSDRFPSTGPLSDKIQISTKALSDAMEAYPYPGILKMAGGNALIAAKVTLSVFRRGKRLLEFFLEGRVSYDMPSSSK
ncbi:hypothetical protein D1604_12805 [Brevundimonas sp. LPMIX5]|uniref:hypothetical protein n=1 Tax=Brevundimonas sp. LPMIX5 TaxID=2305887 RepID=UPI000E66B13B|nr:hypothetical protein [Brevundimonas sp. LPMIX5]RIJ65192.1 hypothetical protein D1604_12805 [Brevundimonas sp. LPMIX5]